MTDPRQETNTGTGRIPDQILPPEGVSAVGQERLTGVQRVFWIVLSVLSGAYILMPLDFWPEMVLGLVGLLDDGVAGMVLLFSLSKLGIRIPFLDRFVTGRGSRKKG